jgi:folate-binding protein YgfZ
MLLTLEAGVKDGVLARLERFVFTEDVTIADVTGPLAAIAVLGPLAAEAIARAVPGAAAADLAALPPCGTISVDRPQATVARVDQGVDGFEVYVDREQAADLESALVARGALEIDPVAAETIRIEAGIPRFLHDMDEETIPLEAGLENRAISFTKGCYVGQEVIVRILHRGHGRVANRLVGLTIDGELLPSAGAAVRHEGRDIGRATSTAWSPALGKPIALATVHRDAAEPGTRLEVDGAPARVTALPFVPPAAPR